MARNDFSSKKRLIFAIILNVAITAAEALAGVITGSLALISDASHNLSDVLSLILGYFGATFSQRKETKKNTFGYKRFEVITSLINASILLVLGTYIFFEAIKRYQNPTPVQPLWVIIVSLIALSANIGSILILNEENKTLNLKAVILHLALDSIASVGVIVSGILIYLYNLYLADIIISILISILIFYSAFDVLREVYIIIMQGIPQDIDFREIKDFLEDFEEIHSIHDLHIWSLSSKEKVLSCHICPSLREIDRTELIREIEEALIEEFGIDHITLQIEETKMCKTGNHSP